MKLNGQGGGESVEGDGWKVRREVAISLYIQ